MGWWARHCVRCRSCSYAAPGSSLWWSAAGMPTRRRRPGSCCRLAAGRGLRAGLLRRHLCRLQRRQLGGEPVRCGRAVGFGRGAAAGYCGGRRRRQQAAAAGGEEQGPRVAGCRSTARVSQPLATPPPPTTMPQRLGRAVRAGGDDRHLALPRRPRAPHQRRRRRGPAHRWALPLPRPPPLPPLPLCCCGGQCCAAGAVVSRRWVLPGSVSSHPPPPLPQARTRRWRLSAGWRPPTWPMPTTFTSPRACTPRCAGACVGDMDRRLLGVAAGLAAALAVG